MNNKFDNWEDLPSQEELERIDDLALGWKQIRLKLIEDVDKLLAKFGESPKVKFSIENNDIRSVNLWLEQ
jgi:hypothetical protein